MFFIASAAVKCHYMFTSWDSVEEDGVTFQWGKTMFYVWDKIGKLRVRGTGPGVGM